MVRPGQEVMKIKCVSELGIFGAVIGWARKRALFKNVFYYYKDIDFLNVINNNCLFSFEQQHCSVWRLKPGGIRTRDLLFWGRTRWPVCHAAEGGFLSGFLCQWKKTNTPSAEASF
jgi:hypothetical protein